jgi:aminopeptidase N
MAVHALRRTIGDGDFFRLLKVWTAERRDGNGSIEDFLAVAERVSGESLTGFAQAWLDGTGQPARP